MNQIKEVYLAKNKKNDIWKESSSGGVFFEIAKYIIKKDGVVYGVAYDNNNNVVHQREDTLEGCKKFMGSKYVQSQIKDTFKECKNDLKNGKYVLFTGTPCEIAGLISYLGTKDIENLYTQDIVCHGAPSPEFYLRYIKFMENELKTKISKINFRSKILPGAIQDIMLVGKNGKVYKSYGTHDIYYNFFSKDIILRPCCYKCKFASLNRVADITLADFWGEKERLPNELKEELGISSVFINSEKGIELWNKIKKNFNAYKSNLNVCMQPNLKNPSKAKININEMWEDFNNYDFKKLIEKYIGSYEKMKKERILKNALAISGILPFYKKVKRRIFK